jgi:hypothetical protein
VRDKLIEVMARAIWDARCKAWGKYRQHLHERDSEGYDWEDLSLSKHAELLREATAALAALEAEGYRVVPVEPTEVMLAATAPAHEGERIIAKVMYRAMLSAAQGKTDE